MIDRIQQLTDDEFEAEILHYNKPSLIFLYAEWCKVCLSVAPVIEQIAYDLKGKIKIRQLDVDTNYNTVRFCNVKAIPALIFFEDGKVREMFIGNFAKNDIVRRIRRLLT